MGYGFYFVGPEKLPAGYMVPATCDKRGCGKEIDRGLAYLCGDSPGERHSDEGGCGRYYCEDHRGWVGPRGGCPHHGKYAWGRTLACMNERFDGAVVCLRRVGHDGRHGSEDESW